MNVDIIVGGTKFTLNRDIIVNGPDSKLKRLILCEKDVSVFSFDRPKSHFKAILAYYQTGRLHLPTNACPVAFQDELKFWEISHTVLEKCCRIRFLNFLLDQKHFEGFSKFFISPEEKLDILRRSSCHGKVLSKIWNIVENQDSNVLAKAF
ncbi:hypothetical protein KUTeg_017309 [Tegillarca granosa]|uniref:Potassium channel tetramerisation-type BTB domain-containing protein n=1 Tax=Tegillarca granosa TaxID=220873 RepID=A0ABQ9EIN1_TEGGR|nr:hypothetical protein KUTeg_017309 [Tegillarca granosa]